MMDICYFNSNYVTTNQIYLLEGTYVGGTSSPRYFIESLFGEEIVLSDQDMDDLG